MPEDVQGKGHFVGFCLLLFVSLFIYYWPFLLGGQSFYISDLTYYFEPLTRFITQSYRQGHLPLWNPYLYCGMPQLAVPSPGMFYPPAAVFLCLPFSQALATYLLAHQMVCGVGAFLLITALGWGAAPAAVAGITAALCGYMLSLSTNYTLVATACWLPLLVFCIKSIGAERTPRNIGFLILAAVCAALMVSAGRPEVSVPAFMVAVAYAILSAWNQWRRGESTKESIGWQLGLRMAGLIAGGLLTMPIILPALEWVRLSPRAHGLELRWVLMWSANWYDCLCIVFPQPLGDLTYLGTPYLNLAASRPHAIPYLTSAFVGTIVITLALWSVLDNRWHWRPWVLLVFAGSLLMAMGNFTPAGPLVAGSSPLLASFRYPVKLLIFPVFCLCLMAAHGMQLAAQHDVPKRSQVVTAFIWLLTGVWGAVLMVIPDLWQIPVQLHWWSRPAETDNVVRTVQHLIGESFLIGSMLALVMQGAYMMSEDKPAWQRGFSVLLPIVLAANLLFPGMLYSRHATTGDFFERPSPVSEQARDLTKGFSPSQKIGQRILTLYFDPLTPPPGFLQRQRVNFQHGFYLFGHLMMLPNCNLDFGVPYSFGYEAAETGIFKELFNKCLLMSTQNRFQEPAQSDLPIARFCKMTSTGYVFTQSCKGDDYKPLPFADKRYFNLVSDDRKKNVRIYKVIDTLPRAFFAKRIRWQTTADQFMSKMLLDNDDWNIDEMWVEGKSTKKLLPGDPETGEQIAFVEDKDDSVAVKTRSGLNHLLMLTDHWYPGWVCRIDGEPTQIYRVNSFCRGVVVPSGEHTIRFSYEPLSLLWGSIVTAFVATLLCAGFLFAYFGNRRRKSIAYNEDASAPVVQLDRTPPS